MMEELIKKNGKGVWMREIEKALRRYGASLEWPMRELPKEIEKSIQPDRIARWTNTRRTLC